MVLIISIAKYDWNKIDPLPGTQNDKLRLKRLFRQNYDYKVITTKNDRVTEDDVERILLDAKKEFKNEKAQYQGIMIFWSGHGDQNNLLMSDYKKTDKGIETGIYPRSSLISYFNGNNIRTKAAAFKLFFIDSCRGAASSQVYPYSFGDGGIGHRGNKNIIHPEDNRSILYSNPDTYSSYEVPYDEQSDDIAWHRLSKQNYMKNKNWPKCGIFMNAVYRIFKQNSERKIGFMFNYGKIQDMIRKEGAKPVPVYGDFNVKVGQKIEASDTINNDTKLRMYFMSKAYKLEIKTKDRGGDNDGDDEKKMVDEVDEHEICVKLLKEWKLEKYIKILVDDNGYEDVEDWRDLSVDELKLYGFKDGHAKKFVRKTKAYFDK